MALRRILERAGCCRKGNRQQPEVGAQCWGKSFGAYLHCQLSITYTLLNQFVYSSPVPTFSSLGSGACSI